MPKIISVQSFRHGTGKSILTVNLAVQLAQQGYHVGVIDANFQSPSIHLLFGIDSTKTDAILNHTLGTAVSIEEEGTDTPWIPIAPGQVTVIGKQVILPSSNQSLDAIAQELSPGYELNALVQGIWELVHRLNLNYLLVDTAPGSNEVNLLMTALSDVMLLVLTLDHQDFQGSAVIADLAQRLDVPQILLIANQVLSKFYPSDVREQLETVYQRTVAGLLPLSQTMLQFASHSGIFCLHYPEHPFCIATQEIAHQITASVYEREGAIASTLLSASNKTSPPPRTSANFRVIDLLMLPDSERRLMSWLIRHGRVTAETMMTYIDRHPDVSVIDLDHLIDQGRIEPVTLDGNLYYQYPILPSKKNMDSALWNKLDPSS